MKIYLLQTLIDSGDSTSEELTAVKRKVAAISPLFTTLEMLFAPGELPGNYAEIILTKKISNLFPKRNCK